MRASTALSHPGAKIQTNKVTPKKFLHSGELAQLTGLSTDTLRYYERKGLISKPLRSDNGYRQYSIETLNRVHVIRGALSVGFTIQELAEIFRERDRGGRPCEHVRDLATTKLAELEIRLKEIEEIRNALRSLLKDWNVRLSKTKFGQTARLLESLPASIPASMKGRKKFNRS